jgi:predicted enzyme related to lactoylglutathione lyase
MSQVTKEQSDVEERMVGGYKPTSIPSALKVVSGQTNQLEVVIMSEQNASNNTDVPVITENSNIERGQFLLTFPVRMVLDVQKSQAWYRDVFDCDDISGYGHAARKGMGLILKKAVSEKDIRPNAVSKKRSAYPTEWDSPDYSWDSLIYVDWSNLEFIVEKVREKGGTIAVEPFEYSHGTRIFKRAHILDLDGYNMVLSARKEKSDEQKATPEKQEFTFKKTIQVRLVSDLKKSLEWYRNILGCDEVNEEGYARRGEMEVILQEAVSPDEVHPNAVPADNEQWDTFVHVAWEDVWRITEEVREKGGNIGVEPFVITADRWDFSNAHILDPDGYNIILGGMRDKH